MFHLSAWLHIHVFFLIKILRTLCSCSSTASLQWNCTACNFCQLWFFLLLRNTFGTGTSVCQMQCQLQIELWVEKALGKRLWTANPLPNKGHGDLWPIQVNAQGRGSWPQTSACLDCVSIKAHGFLCLGSLLRGTQLELLFCYCYCSKIKLFEASGHLRFCCGEPGIELVRKPHQLVWLCEVGVCSEGASVWAQVKCDCQRGAWMVGQGSFLNSTFYKYTTLIYILISSWILVLALSELF